MAMQEQRRTQRSRSYKGGKILFNNKRSVISCTVRNLSAEGANLQVESALGVPAFVDVLIEGEPVARPSHVVWKAPNRIGVVFPRPDAPSATTAVNAEAQTALTTPAVAAGTARGDLLSLRIALDEVPLGIVLLDANLRAQFINRAFRTLWRLPDAKAETKPAFVTLMYHGRDTRAYDVPESELGKYVEG
jgi:PAS domain-containing protein